MAIQTPSAAVTIRRARPEDTEPCGQIYYKAFHKINSDHNFPPEIPTPEMGIRVLQMMFSHPSFYCVVAEMGGAIAAAIVWMNGRRSWESGRSRLIPRCRMRVQGDV